MVWMILPLFCISHFHFQKRWNFDSLLDFLLQQYILECVHIKVEVKFESVAAAIISIHRIVNLRSHFGSSFLEFALFFRIRFVFLEFKNSSFLFEFADGGPASR